LVFSGEIDRSKAVSSIWRGLVHSMCRYFSLLSSSSTINISCNNALICTLQGGLGKQKEWYTRHEPIATSTATTNQSQVIQMYSNTPTNISHCLCLSVYDPVRLSQLSKTSRALRRNTRRARQRASMHFIFPYCLALSGSSVCSVKRMDSSTARSVFPFKQDGHHPPTLNLTTSPHPSSGSPSTPP
jgi:hypothetical protein